MAEGLIGQFSDALNKTEYNEVQWCLQKERLLLKGLNPSKALGPDEFHPGVLKELPNELGPV